MRNAILRLSVTFFFYVVAYTVVFSLYGLQAWAVFVIGSVTGIVGTFIFIGEKRKNFLNKS